MSDAREALEALLNDPSVLRLRRQTMSEIDDTRPTHPTERCPNCGKLCWLGECNHSSTYTTRGFSSTLYGVCKECARIPDEVVKVLNTYRESAEVYRNNYTLTNERRQYWQDRIDALDAAILALREHREAPAVPEGWKLVPMEPTEDMLTEGIDAGRIDEDDVLWTWSGMLAAAPDPEDDHET